MGNPINFKQEREFGDVLSATFTFLGQNYKPLGMMLLKYVFPFVLITSILMTYFNVSLMANSMGMGMGSGANIINMYKEFTLLGVFYIIMATISYTLFIGVLYGYIKMYITHGFNNFTENDVWKFALNNFFSIFGTNIIFGLVIAIGFIFLIIPGIYLATSLSLILVILLMEGKGLGNAFSRSFEITHKQWWWTFLLLIVVYIMISLINTIFQIPLLIYQGLSAFHSAQGGVYEADSTIYGVFLMISQIVSHITIVFPMVALTFHYFSIVESIEKPSLQNEIDTIGE